MDYLDNTKYQKTKSEINNYVIPYAICDNTNFNWLIEFVMFFGLIYVSLKTTRI